MAPIVEQVCSPIVLGEGPHWDHTERVLYYVDIKSCTVHRFNPVTKEQTVAKVAGEPVSLILPVAGKKDQFIISQGRVLSLLTWDGKSKTPTKVEPILTVDAEQEKLKNRINDGKTDPTGRLWAGTMGAELGGGKFVEANGMLFSFCPVTRTVTKHAQKIGIGNGLAWSFDRNTMYYIDSLAFKVDAFDFQAAEGKISNRRTIFDFKSNKIEGLPDGMTIDTEGMLWVCCFSGSQILRINPTTGKILQQLPIPALQVTSLAFGGANLDELYVTTANLEPTKEITLKYPQAGAVFKVTGLGVTGLPGVPVNMDKLTV